jgi:hypothetical protein
VAGIINLQLKIFSARWNGDAAKLLTKDEAWRIAVSCAPNNQNFY